MNIDNRLLIYFFFDADGVVDDYNIYMLQDMMKSCQHLFVISNGKLTKEGYEKFSKLADCIVERNNTGFDVGAYKEALQTIGWEELSKYDEVILMNYTIMGPVYPFEEMFETMDNKQDLDFWGITKYHEVRVDPYGKIKCGFLREHIQYHFIAVRNKMLTSDDFYEYWEKMPPIKSYGDSVAYHESYFTHHFAKKGFKWDVYVNTDDMKKFTEYPLLKAPKKLIEEKRCPIFKRRSFNHDYIDFINTTIGEPTYELMEYLKNSTNYDVNLIWNNILRCCNQAKIKECLQLNYVIPSKISPDISGILEKRRIALVLHLYYEELLEESFQYASSMPAEADVYITVGNKRMKELVEKRFDSLECRNLKVMQIPNRGRDVGSVLVAVNPDILQYDYVCFAHDKKVTQLKPECKGASWAYLCFESVLKNKDHVNNVIQLFEDNPRLGLLTPTPPNHAEYFPTMGNEWAGNFKNTKKLAEQLDIHVPMSSDQPPISALGCFFWYRPKAMIKLYARNFSYEDFPEEPMKKTDGTILHAVERLYSFAVQDAGYYPAWCFSDNVASMEITNLYYMLRGMNMAMMNGGLAGTFVDVVNEMKRRGPAMRSLSDLHNELMGLYGSGASAKSSFDGMMHLYYSEGEGFNERSSEICRASFRKNRFEVEFEIPDDNSIIEQLRFDPGEEGMIILKKMYAFIEYEDGHHDIIEMETCDSNGFSFDNKILFINQDPQVYIQCGTESRAISIMIKGELDKDVTPDIVERAINQRLPMMTPKLYFDTGNGINETDALHVVNRGNAERIEASFTFNQPIAIKMFRFDPCEQGMFIVQDPEINIIYSDDSSENLQLSDLSTNGYRIENNIFYLNEDPQMSWTNRKGQAVKQVWVSMNVSQEFDASVMDEILSRKESLVSFAKKHLK